MAGKENILEESLMKTSLKRICTGKTRGYVDMNENVMSFARLRNDVLDYALKKHRAVVKATTQTGMDLSSIVKEMKKQLNTGLHEGMSYAPQGDQWQNSYNPTGKGAWV